MTSFLVHYDDGRYRDALVRCLTATYDGSQDPDLLARLTGIGYAELDKQYQAYMAGRRELGAGSQGREPGAWSRESEGLLAPGSRLPAPRSPQPAPRSPLPAER